MDYTVKASASLSKLLGALKGFGTSAAGAARSAGRGARAGGSAIGTDLLDHGIWPALRNSATEPVRGLRAGFKANGVRKTLTDPELMGNVLTRSAPVTVPGAMSLKAMAEGIGGEKNSAVRDFQQAYLCTFARKCAAVGLDPEQMFKQAQQQPDFMSRVGRYFGGGTDEQSARGIPLSSSDEGFSGTLSNIRRGFGGLYSRFMHGRAGLNDYIAQQRDEVEGEKLQHRMVGQAYGSNLDAKRKMRWNPTLNRAEVPYQDRMQQMKKDIPQMYGSAGDNPLYAGIYGSKATDISKSLPPISQPTGPLPQ